MTWAWLACKPQKRRLAPPDSAALRTAMLFACQFNDQELATLFLAT